MKIKIVQWFQNTDSYEMVINYLVYIVAITVISSILTPGLHIIISSNNNKQLHALRFDCIICFDHNDPVHNTKLIYNATRNDVQCPKKGYVTGSSQNLSIKFKSRYISADKQC